MPTIFRKWGYRFHFYSNERNEPPHIHVAGKGGEMKIWLKSLSIEFSFKMPPSELRKIMSVVLENRKLFLEKWNEFAAKKD